MTGVAPYGSWKSPISAEQLARGGVELVELQTDGEAVLWLELRPAEGGRHVLCRWDPDRQGAGTITQLTPDGFNVRTRVHEYGGGAFLARQGVVWFANFADQRLYRQDPGRPPRPITPEPAAAAALRYADADATPDGALLVCVRERHDGSEVTNELVALPADGSAAPWVIAGGRDFYAAPRLSPDGRQLAWLEWDHPNMPWDGTELRVAEVQVEGGPGAGPGRLRLAPSRLVAGGPDESVGQPSWSADGDLYFISDRTGWWNLYRRGRDTTSEAEPLAPMEAEFGSPQWVFGLSNYTLLPGSAGVRIACAYGRGPIRSLGVLAPGGGPPKPLELPYTSFSSLHALGGRLAGKLACVAGSPARFPEVALIDPDSGEVTALRRSRELDVDPAYLSSPQPIEFPTDGGQTAHALWYPPANPAFQAPEGERPPLLVTSHGGPTSQASSVLNLAVQYFTSRGFAVVDVDYGGSTGYGRAYRQRLNGRWGIVDVADCANAALYLAGQGRADPKRLAIRGGSAGGYTTLAVLTFRDDFAVGASYYGVADLEALAKFTHKFESRYLDRLIGPYPEAAEVYRERSPLYHTERLSCPVILLQGLEDVVVPPAQAETMAAALDAKGIPYAYLAFEGEQHGFRRAENIQRAAEAELYFYSRILGFDLADPVEPIEIHHL